MYEIAAPALSRFTHNTIEPFEAGVRDPCGRSLQRFSFVIYRATKRQIDLYVRQTVTIFDDESPAVQHQVRLPEHSPSIDRLGQSCALSHQGGFRNRAEESVATIISRPTFSFTFLRATSATPGAPPHIKDGNARIIFIFGVETWEKIRS